MPDTISAMAKKHKAQELFRGDDRDQVNEPNPNADASIVRHVLYLEGKGRESPYLSTSEDEGVAERFDASRDTAVWTTDSARIGRSRAKVRSKTELLNLLKGRGKGAAAWPRPFEVMQARKYVEMNQEHLLDFSQVDGSARAVVDDLFSKG